MNKVLLDIAAPRIMYPEDVKGCVLSLRADKSNRRNTPVLASGVTSQAIFSDMSKYRNDVTLPNLGGTVASGFIKTPVPSNKGMAVSYAQLLANSALADTTGWLKTSSMETPTFSGGVVSITANAQNGEFYNTFTLQTAGDRLYFSAQVKSSSSSVMWKVTTSPTQTTKSHSGSGNFERLSNIYTVAANPSYNRASLQDARASGWNEIQMKEPMCINLTTNTAVQALETALGRNLTAEECDRLFAFTATSNSVNIDTPYSLSLDGTDDYGSLVNTPSLDITTNEFALCCTFRVAVGASTGYIMFKGYDGVANSQYVFYYDNTNKIIYLRINNAAFTIGTDNNSIVENTFYNVIFYRNSSGVVTPYLNKQAKTSGNYATALSSTNNTNVRMGARSSNTGGTTHAAYLKGGLQTMSIYQAPKLNISNILKVEGNISSKYTGVS
jgi:hypothetical protein